MKTKAAPDMVNSDIPTGTEHVYMLHDLELIVGITGVSVIAHGLARTGGWKKARLVPYLYKMPPGDGIQDFDMVAEPGGGTQRITPIDANIDMGPGPSWLRGVRVHSENNSRTELLLRTKVAPSDFKTWTAYYNLMPPGPSTLHVVGTWGISDPPQVALVRAVPQGINPTELILVLKPLPPSESEFSTSIHYSEAADPGKFSSIMIRFPDGSTKSISEIEVVH